MLSFLSALALAVADAPAAALSPPPLERGKAAGSVYEYQAPPGGGAAGQHKAPLLVYFHGMQRGDPLGIERESGLLDALRRWAADHGHALLLPHAGIGACAGTPVAGRDWACWDGAAPTRDWRRVERLIAALDKAGPGFAERRAVGFSRGAYFVSAAWARGHLDRWAAAGLIAGAQPQDGFSFSPRTPPLTIEVARGDPGNAAYVAQFLAPLDGRSGAPARCVRAAPGGHLPAPERIAPFLDAMLRCRTTTAAAAKAR